MLGTLLFWILIKNWQVHFSWKCWKKTCSGQHCYGLFEMLLAL
jgi:hypothetical protein